MLGSQIVTGFGPERVDDVQMDYTQRVDAGCLRAAVRRDTGERGSFMSFGGQELDRSAGGSVQALRRGGRG